MPDQAAQSGQNVSPWIAQAERYLREEAPVPDEGLAENIRKLVSLRQLPLALRVADARLSRGGHSAAILHRKGLVLSRLGALLQARAIAEALVQDRETEPKWRAESYGLAGRVSKMLDRMASELGLPSSHRQLAFQSYLDGFRSVLDSDPKDVDAAYLGINAATLALLLDDRQRWEVNALARKAQDRCEAEMSARTAAGGPDPWHLAILAEAALLRDARDEAERYYFDATERMAGQWGDLASMRANARLIVAHRDDGATTWADERIRIPRVAMFAGHMVDAPSRPSARFPASMEEYVRERLAEIIEREDVGFAHASAAAGGDILFHEAVRVRAVAPGTLGLNRIVLPFAREAFRAASVEFGDDGRWGKRFDAIVDAPDAIVRWATRERDADDPAYFGYAQRLVTGFAELEAREFGDRPVALTLWDERRGDGVYGTASAVDAWRRHGYDVRNIYPVGLRFSGVSLQSRATHDMAATTPPPRRWRSDALGEYAAIVTVLVPTPPGATERDVGERLGWLLSVTTPPRDQWANDPPRVRSRADGVDFICRSARIASRLGLDIQSALRAEAEATSTNGPACGSPVVLLHSALVFPTSDPSTGAITLAGGAAVDLRPSSEHLPPGYVVCSESFTACAAIDGVKGTAWEPIALPAAHADARGEVLYCLGEPIAQPIDWSRRFASKEVEQRLADIRVPARSAAGRKGESTVDSPSRDEFGNSALGGGLSAAWSRTLLLLSSALSADAITVWLPSPDREWLLPINCSRSEESAPFTRAERSRRGLLGLVLATGDAVRWSYDPTSLPSLQELPIASAAIRAFLAVPLGDRGETFGVLSLARSGDDGRVGAFSSEEESSVLDLAEVLGAQLHWSR